MRVNLDVPYLSQRDAALHFDWDPDPGFEPDVSNVAYWACGITSLTMILHYYGLTDESVYELLMNLKNKNSEGHYSLIRGYDTTNNTLIFNDPWGETQEKKFHHGQR